MCLSFFKLIMVITISISAVRCQTKETQQMDFEKYDFISTFVAPEHKQIKAKFPSIDVRNHQWRMAAQNPGPLVKEMDSLNLKVMINLSGSNVVICFQIFNYLNSFTL